MTPLAEIIRAEIRSAGPIPFERFMELALYHPGAGYYERERSTVGRGGDFYTSVSVGPLFGELLAWQFAEWSAAPELAGGRWQILEAGAHDGRLAADILGWLRKWRPELFESVEYWLVEPSARRREWQQETLADFAPRVKWHRDWKTIPSLSVRGIIFSNELLDAFPVRRMGWDAREQRWFDWGVDWRDEHFVWTQLCPANGLGCAAIELRKVAREVDSRGRGIGQGSFPPTPTFSPEERGLGVQPVRPDSACRQEQDPVAPTDTPSAIPPLPGGEGRGEGSDGVPGPVCSSPRPFGAPSFLTPMAVGPGWREKIPDRLRAVLPDGFTLEECPAAAVWWSRAASRLGAGRLLTFDYGLMAEELLQPARANGTLRAFRGHRAVGNVLADPGAQDLTAHVNFSEIEQAGLAGGLITETLTRQGRFLGDVFRRIAALPGSFAEWTAERGRQFQALTHPGHLGEAFRVLVQRR